MTRAFLIFCGFAMLGCAGPVAETAPDAPLPDLSPNCGAEDFQYMRWQPQSALDGIALPTATRVIQPGMAVTMDYRPDRLNVSIGKTGRIERIYCG